MMFYCWDSEPKERPSFTQLVKVMFVIIKVLNYYYYHISGPGGPPDPRH